MNIMILGPQGSGKGTQAELLVKQFGFNYVEMGEILRSIANSNNPKAEEIKGYLNSGKLVPDEFVRTVAWDHISKKESSLREKKKGFIFDGYPRSVAQFEQLEDMLRRFGKKIDKLIYITIPEEESIKRLSARRDCTKCGRIWNQITNPPPGPETCECGGKLTQRGDDQPEAIKNRLGIFHANTGPILKKAREEGILTEVDGERPIEAIHEEIVKELGL